MPSYSGHSERIAKNSLLLYVRLVLTMAVMLYTSRVVLNVLGEVDFGIYSVVAGVVVMIAFLNNSLTIATQRFLNYEMARPGERNLSDVFSTAVISHYAIAVIVALLAETIGLWFVKTQLVIPPERMGAALVVFHSSVAALFFKIIGSPYTAAVIAGERMKVYALISIMESVLTLALVILLVRLPYDKLAAYGILMMAVGIIVRASYIRYCRTKFPEYRFRWVFHKDLFQRMFSFTGWIFAGTFTGMLTSQGINVLINLYFGPVLNAARAIAVKVQGVVQSFVDSLITAVQPQIVKSYSADETSYMGRLVYTSSKLSFYIVMLLSLPVLFNTGPILRLWLKEVPECSVLLTQLLLADTLITCSYAPLGTLSQASGRIKYYQLIISASFALIFLLTWLSFKLGYPVHYAFVISIAVNFIALFARLLEMKRTMGFDMAKYLRHVTLPEGVVLCFSLSAAFVATRILGSGKVIMAICSAVIYLGFAAAMIYLVGLDRSERQFARGILLRTIRKKPTE